MPTATEISWAIQQTLSEQGKNAAIDKIANYVGTAKRQTKDELGEPRRDGFHGASQVDLDEGMTTGILDQLGVWSGKYDVRGLNLRLLGISQKY